VFYTLSHLDIKLKHVGGTLWFILTGLTGSQLLPPNFQSRPASPTSARGSDTEEPHAMIHTFALEGHPSEKVTCQVSEVTIAQLVGQVYEYAPPAERSRLLAHLLRPLGVLSLVAIANGIFATIRFRSSGPDLHVPLEDAQNVQVSDIITLVNHVQQVSVHAVDGLADMLAGSPVMAGSAAAALLITVLVQRARTRRASDLTLPSAMS